MTTNLTSNPPPREIPNTLFKNGQEKAFYVKLVAALRLVFDRLSGQEVIVETSVDYQSFNVDDKINADASLTVTLVDFADAIKQVTISSTNGTVTLAGDVTIESPTSITTGVTVTVYPARGQWWQA